MQKWQFTAIIFGIAILTIFTCGCISQIAAPQQSAPATTISIETLVVNPLPTTMTITTRPTLISTTIITTVSTPEPLLTPVNTGALDASVHLQSKKPGYATFTTVRPGKVNIRVYCMWPGYKAKPYYAG